MKISPLNLLALALAVNVLACTRTSEVKTDEKLDVQQNVKARATEQTAETIKSGPVDKSAASENDEFGIEAEEPDGSLVVARVGPAPVRFAPGSKVIGTVPLNTAKAASTEHDAPVVDAKAGTSTQASTASLAEKQEKASDTKKKTSYWPPWWVWALGACGVALGIAILRKTLLGRALAAAEAAAGKL